MAEDTYNQILRKLNTIGEKSKQTDAFLSEVEKKFATMRSNEEEMMKQSSETVKTQSEISQKIGLLTETVLPGIKEAATRLAAKQNELKASLENSCWTQTQLLSEMEQLMAKFFDKDPSQKEEYKSVEKELFRSLVLMNSEESSLKDCNESFEKIVAEVKTTISGVDSFLREDMIKVIVETFAEDVKNRKSQSKPK